jgi:hypothetical protein
MMKKKKSEVEVFSPTIDVGGYKLKPWSFEQFINLLPTIVNIASILKEKNIEVNDLEDIKNDLNKLSALALDFGPLIPAVVAETLKMDIKKVNEMDFDQVITMVLVIFIQNAEKLKNFSGLGKTAMQSLMKS